MKKIDISTPTYPNMYALVDDQDYDELSKHKWSARRLRNSHYVQRGVSAGKKRAILTMHRAILGLRTGDGIHGDHINGNGLDNRRSNLRKCTNQQNHFNMRTTTGTSKYKGVSKISRPQKRQWLSQVMHSESTTS